jgi:hypothetical protein
MKSYKWKRGSSFTDTSPPSGAQRRELSFPPPEECGNIVRDFKLTPAQAGTLEITLEEAIDGLSRYQKSQPNRRLLVDRLKRFEKAIAHLHDECRHSADLMQFFLPHNTQAYIGQSMTFSTMSEAVGRDVFPRNFDFQIKFKLSQNERITLPSLEQHTRPMRQALGLKHGHLILAHFIERIHAPLARWIELNRLNKGGRYADVVRRYLIYQLAEAAPQIIGKPAAVAVTGTSIFALRCCKPVACRKAASPRPFPPVVRKLRADQIKSRRRSMS